MKLKITTQMLRDMNACQSGVDDFERITGGKLVCEWTPEKQIELLKTDLRKWFGWAVFNKLLPEWSMSRADLSGANLSWANLSGANLSGANLYGATTDMYTVFPEGFDKSRLDNE